MATTEYNPGDMWHISDSDGTSTAVTYTTTTTAGSNATWTHIPAATHMPGSSEPVEVTFTFGDTYEQEVVVLKEEKEPGWWDGGEQ